MDAQRRHRSRCSLKTGGNTDGLQLTLTVHDRVTSRSAFDATLGDSPTFPQTLTLQRLPLDDLPPDANGVRAVQLDLRRLDIRRSGNGVYPLEVQLRDANDTAARRLRDPRRRRRSLRPAPRSRSTSRGCGRSSPPRRSRSTALPTPTSSASSCPPADSAARRGRSAPTPTCPSRSRRARRRSTRGSTLAQAQDNTELAAGVDALRRAVAHHQVLAASFVPARPPVRLRRAGSAAPSATSSTGAADTLQTFFNAHLDPSTAMPGDLDTTSLDALRTARPHPARRRRQRARAVRRPVHGDPPRAPRAAPGDAVRRRSRSSPPIPGSRASSTATQPPALRAAHLLAALAVIQGEQPSLARAVAFANPTDWDPSDEFVTALLAGLRANPFVRPVTVDTLLAETPAATVDDAPDGDPVDPHARTGRRCGSRR